MVLEERLDISAINILKLVAEAYKFSLGIRYEVYSQRS